MVITAFIFYMCALVIVFSGVMVISSRNPVHSVLFLILAFFNSAGIFLLQGAEFLAMIMVVVYVGAVAVLFLFVVMMLDVNFRELQRGFMGYLPMGLLVALILLIELIAAVGGLQLGPLSESAASGSGAILRTPDLRDVSNTEALGNLLYTHYVYLFQGAGMILLVAMLGAIVLTLRVRTGVKRQSIAHQNERSAGTDVELVDVAFGQGLKQSLKTSKKQDQE